MSGNEGKCRTAAALAALLFSAPLAAQMEGIGMKTEESRRHEARMDWWREAKFGMFIHWGVYAVPAGTYRGQRVEGGEWIMNRSRIPVREYRAFASGFNPVSYDPEAWARLAKEAGMKYVVITAKHHDGFALFPSEVTDWDVEDATPYKRDLIGPLAKAARRNGLKFGTYYSQAQDWVHPGGGNYLGKEGEGWDPDQSGSFDRYLEGIAVPQVREILERYRPDILWWDTPAHMNRQRAELFVPLVREHPGMITNDRLGHFKGDTSTPEQHIPDTGIAGRDWETCMTMNNHWGYVSYDDNWKSVETLVRNLVDIVSKGGNYLLNVGPTPEGLIPEASIERLRAVGAWLRLNGKAIYGTQASPFSRLEWGRCTVRRTSGGDRLYLHVFNWPADGVLSVPGLEGRAKRAYLLADAARTGLPTRRAEDALVAGLPGAAPDPVDSVIVLEMERGWRVHPAPLIEAEFEEFLDELAVVVRSEKEGEEVRYTLDGSEPGPASPVSKGDLRLSKDTTILARVFRNGRPVSPTARRTFRKVQPLRGVDVGEVEPGLRYAYYEGEWGRLPDFRALKSVTCGTLDEPDLGPARREENFAIEYRGFLRVAERGVYVFYLESDDGSRLHIGDELVVNNDGLHGMLEKQGTMALDAGLHPLRVEFFQAGGGKGLKLAWRGPGFEKGRPPLFREKSARRAGAPPPKAWSHMKYGLFVHHVYGGEYADMTPLSAAGGYPRDIDDFVSRFDVERWADDVASMGFEYVIFTAWHADSNVLFPSARMAAWRGPGHATTSRDLVGEVVDALLARGISPALYTHIWNGHDFHPAGGGYYAFDNPAGRVTEDMRRTGYFPSVSGDTGKWNDFINDLYDEMCARYGTKVAAMYFDGTWTDKADKRRLLRTIRRHNPACAFIANGTADHGLEFCSKEVGAPEAKDYGFAGDYPPVERGDADSWPGYVRHAAIIQGGNWWAAPGGRAQFDARAVYRYTVLQAAVNRQGGGVAWAFGSYADGSWEKDILSVMRDAWELMKPVAASVKGTVPSDSYPAPEGSKISTLPHGIAATRAADGSCDYLHILTAPSGSVLHLPPPADGRRFREALMLRSGKRAALRQDDSGLHITPPEPWHELDTVIKLLASPVPGARG